jgi:excisionase family DNA binding protein
MIEEPNVPHRAGPVPITVRVSEACRLTGIGRSKFYELISAGEIEVIKVGTITLIPMGALESFVDARRRRG